jgi:hypothetical protein
MRLLSALVFGAVLCALGVNGVAQQPAQSTEKPTQPVFPAVSAYALNKLRVNLPADFAGQSNLLLLSFEREQQKEIDSWLPVAKDLQKANPSFRAYMLPVFTKENLLYRWWENSSLRSSVDDPQWIEFTIPLYVDKPRFRRGLQIYTEQSIVVLLVDKSGRVLWRTDGPLTDEKKAALTAILAPASPSGGAH